MDIRIGRAYNTVQLKLKVTILLPLDADNIPKLRPLLRLENCKGGVGQAAPLQLTGAAAAQLRLLTGTSRITAPLTLSGPALVTVSP